MTASRIHASRSYVLHRYSSPRSWRARVARWIKQSGVHVVRAIFMMLLALLGYSAISRGDIVGAQATHSLDSIRLAAENHVRDAAAGAFAHDATLIVTAGDLDARLRLTQCPTSLRTFTLNGAAVAARGTIGVRCDDAAVNWTVYVPVSVESDLSVLVLKSSLPRNASIAPQDVTLERRRVVGFGNAYITGIDALRDRHLKRATPSGTVLSADLLVRDAAVKRGQQVLLVYEGKGLQIQAPGLAMNDGALADRIRVQNQTSLKVVEGVVESGNLVRVGM